MTVGELAEILSLEVLYEGDLSRKVESIYVGDIIGRAAGKIKRGGAWVTIMHNVNVAAAAEISGAACVILAENVSPDGEFLEKMPFISGSVLRSPDSAYDLAWKLRQATGL